ncbi:hypothetical protein PILCRDRAFT_325371 [Piloderma croceum F 1598]|uniref:Uncharacterized protein n=1 Tax=Piloderma croceum (strain F 1598) TaxID=765440 RepID=A0A0C3C9M8_PILCF|nr:hypothetical protein PILCRDRAFT_325371 [Piloderma croceum F 1598]
MVYKGGDLLDRSPSHHHSFVLCLLFFFYHDMGYTFPSFSSKSTRGSSFKSLKRRVPSSANTTAGTTHRSLQYSSTFFIPDDVFHYDEELRATAGDRPESNPNYRALIRRWIRKMALRFSFKKDNV